MEAVGGIILLLIGLVVLNLLLSVGGRTLKAVAKAAVGEGSLSENMELAFKGIGPFEVRIIDTRLGEDGGGPEVKRIQVKGLFPVPNATRVGFVTSVFDKTKGEFEPVVSVLDGFQESNNLAFQHKIDVGNVSPSQGYLSWINVGAVLPEILQPPHGGERQLVAVLRLVNLDNPPGIQHGFHEPNHPGLIWQRTFEFNYKFKDKGYLEAAEQRDESCALAIRIGVAVAMADGRLLDAEGTILKNWIVRAIKPYSEERQKALKELFNGAMTEAYVAAKKGGLSLSSLTARLNQIGEKQIKYETIELCFEIMAADKIADPEEVRIIRRIAEALQLDLDEIEKMKDQKIVHLDATVTDQASIEGLLGIEMNWDKERVRRHLRAEFQKWNNRLNALPEGEQRQIAQRMIDHIAEARKKYS